MSNEKEILVLEDKRFAAMIGGDWKVVQALTHDQLLYTHSSAVTDTKASWLESMTSGKTKYKSASFHDLYRRAASHVKKIIMQGVRPGDIPIEQPSKFELVVNMRTAQALGLNIPPMLLARADEVIE